jgi:hypothetical protein
MKDVTYRILAEYKELSRSDKAIKKACLVSWNGAAPVLDIRAWSTDGIRAFKGCTLNRSEAELLRDALNNIDFDADFDITE